MQRIQSKQMNAKRKAALNTELDEYMQTNGLRWTKQRRIVTDVFLKADGHLTIDEVLRLATRRDRGIGYVTVYRTLKMLADSGVAHARHFRSEGVVRYELADSKHHDHLICLDCGLIVEFEDAVIEKRQDAVAKAHKFNLAHHSHELYGSCQSCRTPAAKRKNRRLASAK